MTSLERPVESGVTVHAAAGVRQEIHRAYGLWLISGRQGVVSPPKDVVRPRRFEFYGISHLLQGRGFYWTPDGGPSVCYGPGQAVMSVPDVIQDYGGDGQEYVEDSLCFAGPIADSLRAAGILRAGIWEMGLARRLEPLFTLMANPARDAQIRANLLLQNLLVTLYFENQDATRAKERGRRRQPALAPLLARIAADPHSWWPVREMAAQCGLAESQFRRRFVAETGLQPKAYVDQIKMRHAAALLVSRQLTIQAVAAAVGYDDPYHFSRRFKQLMALPPEQYRRRLSLTGPPVADADRR